MNISTTVYNDNKTRRMRFRDVIKRRQTCVLGLLWNSVSALLPRVYPEAGRSRWMIRQQRTRAVQT